jgi:hypothetical protein
MLFFSLFSFLCCIASITSLDVSFIPNDENAPLPLSKKYRDNLRQLCTLLKNKKKLPPEIVAKQKILRKVCKKLESDDRNIDSVFGSKLLDNEKLVQNVFYALFSFGAGYVMWNNRNYINSQIKKWMRKDKEEIKIINQEGMVYNKIENQNANRNPDMDINKILEAREARLKRFAEFNSKETKID